MIIKVFKRQESRNLVTGPVVGPDPWHPPHQSDSAQACLLVILAGCSRKNYEKRTNRFGLK